MNTNDYKCRLIFGRKGCGKSSTLAKLARKSLLHHQHVYSNIPMDFSSDPKIDQDLFHVFLPEDFGFFLPEENSLFLIDEVNVVWDNRSWKSFDLVSQTFFRYQRHFRCTIILFSQSVDVDKKIRSLMDELWIQRKLFGKLTVASLIYKYIYIKSPKEGESDIVEAYEKSHFWIPGSRYFTWLPRYWKYYNSFSRYSLPDLAQYLHFKSDKFRDTVRKSILHSFE